MNGFTFTTLLGNSGINLPSDLTFDLETDAHYCPLGEQPPYNFWYFWNVSRHTNTYTHM